MQQAGDEGASSRADVGRDAVLVAFDFLVGVLQTLRLEGRLAHQ